MCSEQSHACAAFIAHGQVHVKIPQTSGDVQEVCDVSEAKLIRMIMVKSALFHGIVPQAVASCHGILG